MLSLALFVGCPGETGNKDSVPPDDSPGTDDSNTTATDADNDGSPDEEDCAPNDSNIYPEAAEVCDGLDQNCNGQTDEGVRHSYYPDNDADGYGSDGPPQEGCTLPTGYAEQAGDCNDQSAATHPNAPEADCTDPTDYNGDGSSGYTDADQDGVAACEDCDDLNAAIHPSAVETCDGLDNNCDGATDGPDAVDPGTYYTDGDGDGYGADGSSTTSCVQPNGTSALDGDCNDADSTTNPGASEGDCTDPNDYNCDGSTGYADNDGDLYAACADCDDNNPTTYPAAIETCDGADNNCDGAIDEDSAVDARSWYADTDADSYGDPNALTTACNAPSGSIEDSSDCDDGNGDIHPNSPEWCDGLDNNCDGTVDEDSAVDTLRWYADTDADSYGDPSLTTSTCYLPSNYVEDGSDCDDHDATIRPDAIESCDGRDNNCDGTVDEDSALDAPEWYPDADADGYGDPAAAGIPRCTPPSGHVANNDDCDDGNGAVSPRADEFCNNIDDNCDGNTDEDSALDAPTWYADADGDRYGTALDSTRACAEPRGYVGDSSDCDDSNAAISPRADEFCNNIDDNCDGRSDEDSAIDAPTWYSDSDGDNYGDPNRGSPACSQPGGTVGNAEDCDDSSATIHPGAAEYCDGIDSDCNGTNDDDSALNAATWYEDSDNDGSGNLSRSRSACSQPIGSVANSSDCDDTNSAVKPGATETCNSIDDNCDGIIDPNSSSGAPTWYLDSDQDGYGDRSRSSIACSAPAQYVADNSDCNDSNTGINPSASEVCDSSNTDEDCDGSADNQDSSATGTRAYYADADLDGYASPSNSLLLCDASTSYPSSSVGTDCNDNSNTVYPGAAESCNSIDDDCDGTVDDGVTETYYRDADGDGFGSAASSTVAPCNSAPVGYRSDSTDCNDGSATIQPYAYDPSGDGYDSDCDGSDAGRVSYSSGPSGDDVSSNISGSSFPFCGTSYSSYYMNTNGRITLGAADNDFSESLAELAGSGGDIAIMPFWDDLYAEPGETKYAQFSDGMGFYWIGVNEAGGTDSNTFSAVLFNDGTVLLTYGILGSTGRDGLVGWACGGSGTSTPTERNLSVLSYPVGYWGFGTGAERAVVELFTGSGSGDPIDLSTSALRFCSNRDGTRSHCAE